MALAQEDIKQIEQLIQRQLSTESASNANVRYEIDLRERTIRVEEELKHQRELLLTGFKQMDKRFEQVDKRFEQVDKRFEQVDKRFEQQHQEIISIHQEIKLQMRWVFGLLIAIGGVVVGILKLTA